MADSADRAGEIMENSLAGILANAQLPSTVATCPECDGCGTEIPQARRQAATWATTCIECQGIREQQLRHRR